MKAMVDILRGELERLFSIVQLDELCSSYLDVDARDAGLYDEKKVVYVQRIIEWAKGKNAIGALVDIASFLKKDLLDPRVTQGAFFVDYSDIVPGAALGNYKVETKMFDDGVFATYRGAASEGDAKIAFTVVHKPFALDERAVQRYMAAARVMKQIKVKGALSPLDVGRMEDGRPFVAFDGAQFKPLSDQLPNDLIEALDRFEQLLEIVGNLHDKGIVHSNLNTNNVGVMGEAIVVSGFGMDRLLTIPASGSKTLACVCGRFAGIAPEQIRGEEASVSSDIYALGAILFELVTSKHLFDAKTTLDMVARHVLERPPKIASIVKTPTPPSLDVAIERMLDKTPSLRPASVGELRQIVADVRRDTERDHAKAVQTGTRDDIATWAEALLDDPNDTSVLDELMKDASRANAWGAAVDVLVEAAGKAGDASAARVLMMQAAAAAVDHTRDFDTAGALFEQMSTQYPGDLEIIEAKLSMLRAQGNFEELISQLAAKAESTEDPSQKLVTLLDIAQIYESDLGDYNRAFDYLLALVGHGNADETAIERLAHLAELTSRFEELATAAGQLAQGAAQAKNTAFAIFLYGQMGHWYWEKLGQPGYALTCFQQILDIDSSNLDALASVAALYKEDGKWKEYSQMLVRLGESETVPTVQRNNFVDAARIYFTELKETAEARRLAEKVIDKNPGHGGALSLMVQILEQSQEWGRLAELISSGVDSMPQDAEQLDLRLRLAKIHEEHFDNLVAASEQYESILSQDATHLESLQGLERIFQRKGEMAHLVANLEAQLSATITPKQRVAVLEKLSPMVEEEYKDLSKAASYYEEILKIDGRHVAALGQLVRLYRETNNWESLTVGLEKLALVTEAEEQRKTLLHERAEIIRDQIGDAARAADAFAKIALTGEEDALVTLARTQVEAGEFAAAVETIQKVIEASETADEKVEMYLWSAQLKLDKLDDGDGALELLRLAHDAAPENLDALDLLQQVYYNQNNFAAGLDIMDQQFKLTEGSLARAELRAQMGTICYEKLEDSDRAARYFEEARDLDEVNYVASSTLAEIYREAGEWSKALPIYERWADAAGTLQTDEQVELYSHLGEAYDRVGRRDEALKAFAKVAELGADDPNVVFRLGEVALDVGEFELSAKQLKKYIDLTKGSLSGEENAKVSIMYGRALFGLNRVDDAASQAAAVTKIEPESIDALMLLADCQEKQDAPAKVVATLEKLISLTEEKSEEWVGFVRKRAAIVFEKLNDSEQAAKSIVAALEKVPGDRGLLGDLLKVYSAAKRFSDVVEVVLKLADLVDDSRQRSRYYWTAAKVCRRELGEPEKAAVLFDKANAQDPAFGEVRDTLIELLTSENNWAGLEKQYKKFIARLPKSADVASKIALYVPFADVLIDKRQNYKDAAVILEALLNLEPSNIARYERLAELYENQLGDLDKAVSVYRRLLAIAPDRYDAASALFRVFRAKKDIDRAYGAAAIVAARKDGDKEEAKYHETHRASEDLSFDGRLKSEQWSRLIMHPEVDQAICSIFDVISPAILERAGHSHEHFGLTADAAIDVEKDASAFADLVKQCAYALGIDPPTLFYRKDQKTAVSVLDTNPPSIVAGETFANIKDHRAISFELGRNLGLFRPGILMHQVVTSGTQMSSWLLAAIKSVVPTLPVPDALSGKVTERMPAMRDLLASDAIHGERLKGYVQTFVSKSQDVDLKGWARAVDYTLDRVGLLLSGDFVLAAEGLKNTIDDDAVLEDRLQELTLFALSDEYFQLRKALGISL